MAERNTKQELLDAATEEFARHGLPGARMNVIVERAGINERMIYHHFGSKIGLYEAVLAHHFRAPDPPAELPKTSTPAEAFVSIMTAFLEGLMQRPQFLALVLHEAMSGWTHVPKASLSDIPVTIRNSFDAAKRAGAIRKDCRFEVVYLGAIGAVVSGQLLSARFTDLRSEKARSALGKDILNLVMRGAMQ